MATLGPPRGPLKGPSRKSYEKCGSLHLFGCPKGSLWGFIFNNFRVFLDVFSNCFFEALFGRLLGCLGTPSNHENVVSSRRNYRFYISTWSSKVSENDVQRAPFGTPLDGFWVVWGGIWEDEKIVAKIEWAKVTQEIRKFPEFLGATPVFP